MRKSFTVALSVLLTLLLCFSALAAENGNGFSAGELPANGEEDVLVFPTETVVAPPATEAPPEQTDAPEQTPAPGPTSAAETVPAERTQEAPAEPSAQSNLPVVAAVAVLVLAACVVVAMLLRKRRQAAKDDGKKEAGNE